MRLTISASKVSFTLKYSIATFLLCTSSFVAGVFIYPLSLAILSATAIPILFVAVASVSSIIALSSAIYLVKSAVSAINNKNMSSILEEKSYCNDVRERTPMAAAIQLSLPTSNSKESITTNAKTPEKVSVMLDTEIPQAPPPPLPSQNSNMLKGRSKLGKFEDQSHSSNAGSKVPPRDLLEEIRGGFSLKKIESKDKNNSLKLAPLQCILSRRIAIHSPSSGSTHSGNEFDWNDDNQDIQFSGMKTKKTTLLHDSNTTFSQTKSNSTPFIPLPPPLPNQGMSALPPSLLPIEDLKNRKSIKDRDINKRFFDNTSPENSSFAQSKDQNTNLQDELGKRLEEIRKKKDNAKCKMQQGYVKEAERQQEENKVEDHNDNDSIRNIILESTPPSVKLTDVKKAGNSGRSSGYSSDLEGQSI